MIGLADIVAAMRRTVTLIIAATLLAAACGSSDPDTTANADAGAEFSTDATSPVTQADTPAEADAADESGTDAEPVTSFEDVGTPPTSPDKPIDIKFPGAAPTELVITVLTEGTGPVAELGDTVIVDYIGVRSLDGVEFDNSYDRFTPFSVGPLGSAPVIQGWNDGLIGAQTGAQLQLDIPSSLAYGSDARSDTIRADEPLTFVIDVRSVITAPDPADAPTEMGVESSKGATDLSFEDLVEGDGPVLELGQTAVFHLVLFRADTGAELDSTWIAEPIQIPMTEGGFAAIVQGMPGMKVGGRRAITSPPGLGFGEEGNPQIGLPADTDVVIVVDLLGAY